LIDVVDFYGLRDVCIFTGIAFGIAAILIKIFPSLKKVSWKIVISLLVLPRILDVLVTILYFLKAGNISPEVNPVIRVLYNWLGFTPLFFFASILSAALITLFMVWAIKFLICEKVSIGYYLGYGLTIISFLAVLNNYFFHLCLV